MEEAVTITFTSHIGGARNLHRLHKIMQSELRWIDDIPGDTDYCQSMVDGVEFSCDWKHNEFDNWALGLHSLGYKVVEVSANKLVFTIEKPKQGMVKLLTTHEQMEQAYKMFAPKTRIAV